jgi:serine/threonine-protein kinase
MVTVPKFIGQKYTDIMENEEWVNTYNFSKTEAYSDDAAEGVVIDQSEAANRKKEKTEKLIDITLTVSKGPTPPNLMPDYVNTDYRNAKIELNKLQLNLEIIEQGVFDDNYTENYIIETKPPKGEALDEGQPVYLIYSKGPENRLNDVPNVVGYLQADAERTLQENDFVPVIDREDFDPTIPAGRVISQSPEDGKEAPFKSEVYIVISKGPLPESPSPSPSEPISPDVSESPGVSESPPVTEAITSPSP